MRSKEFFIAFAVVIPAAHRVITPVVEDSGAIVVAGEALIIVSHLTQFLTIIDHEGTLGNHRTYHQEGDHLGGIVGKLARGEAHLVMIFQEVEHPVADAVDTLPAGGKLCGRHVISLDTNESIVEIDLVIEIIEATIVEERTIGIDIIYFTDKDNLGIILLDLRNRPMPELSRHHKDHIAAEAVDTLRSPETEHR